MKSIAWTLGAAGGLLLCSNVAQAKEFADKGTFAFGVERVFGFYRTHRDLDNGQQERTNDRNTFSFAITSFPAPVPYALPRLGFDVFIIDHLSLGGSFGFATWDNDEDRTNLTGNGNRNTQTQETKSTLFLVSPRVGYAVMFGDVVGIWPRGGLTYYSQTDSNGNDVNEHSFALTLEFHLVIVPLEHVGITLGPVIDIGFAGNREPDNPNDPDWDLTQHSFGFIAAGMFGWL